MSYQVLARKYRPKDFEDVIGQKEVIRTLKNSIDSGRIANAYIFSGPRGIGKTSVARLIAKRLNCDAPPEESPCSKCENCLETMQGKSMDVIEIDGASNTGVDDVRTLRENVKFSPAKGKYKVYIIDEVHMLSQGAFNALLKTLEEPPSHVKFIFATTEPHKVPATILSRCQRFDFKKISPKMIQENVLRIAREEKIEIHPEGALLIARESDGSVRDSLVMLEQMQGYSREKITAEDIVELLGLIGSGRMQDLVEAVIDKDASKAIKLVDEMIVSGRAPRYITDSLIENIRGLMVFKASGGPTRDMAFTEEEEERMSLLAEKVSLEGIFYMMQNLISCLKLIRSVRLSRAPLELTLIKLAKREEMFALSEVMKELKALSDPAFNGSVARTDKDGSSGHDFAPERAKPEKKAEEGPKASTLKKKKKDLSTNTEKKGPDFNIIEKQWHIILNLIKKRKMSVCTYLQPARPVELNGSQLVIGFPKNHSFNRDALNVEQSKEMIVDAVSRVAGKVSRVELVVLDFLGEEEDEQKKERAKKTSLKEMKPAIESVMDTFGGHIVRDQMEGD